MKLVSYSSAFYKAIITTLLMVLVYQFYYVEIIRANIEDLAFDIVNEFATYFIEDNTDSPNVILFKIDNEYLKSKNLMDENNETTYGYVFPRDQLTDLIKTIDNFSKSNKENSPSVVFIDIDLSYPSIGECYDLFEKDRILIEELKKERSYKILIPKQSHRNFIESSSDPVIQRKIKDKEIIFVSIGLTQAADNISRRYYPYEKYKNNLSNDEYYPNASVMMWALNKKYELNNLTKYFHTEKQSLIENRIIFKKVQMVEKNENFSVSQSYWKKLTMYSAHYPLNNIPTEKFKNSIILLGSTHSASSDRFTTNTLIPEVSGVEMHANSLMTLFYLNGKLNRMSLVWTCILVFTIVFLVNLMIQRIGYKYTVVANHVNRFTIGVSVFFMIICSVYLLLALKLWFNWFILALITPFSIYFITLNKLFKNTINIIQIVLIWLVSNAISNLFKFKNKRNKK